MNKILFHWSYFYEVLLLLIVGFLCDGHELCLSGAARISVIVFFVEKSCGWKAFRPFWPGWRLTQSTLMKGPGGEVVAFRLS